jgi:hypothetical protein
MAEARKGQQARTARTAEATAISEGGVIVKDGADIIAKDGGSISAEYPSGRPAAFFGPLVLEGTDVPDGHGLLVQADDDGQGRDVFRAKYANGQRLVTIGQTPGEDTAGAVDKFLTDALFQDHHSHGSEGFRIHGHHGGNVRILTSDGGLIRLQSSDNGDVEVISDDRLWLYADGDLDGTVNGEINLAATGTGFAQLLSVSGQAALAGGAGTFLQPQSGSGTANVRMDTTTGQITWVASTERVKSDIQNLQVDPSVVLQMRPRTWLPGPTPRQCPEWMHNQHTEDECHAGELVDPPADSPREVGFVAEELDALGLTVFVEYDASGLPVSIRYDRMTAALIPVVHQQAQQITALQDALTALTERVTALEPQPAEEAP